LEEFEYVFEEFIGFPQNRDMDFSIDIILGSALVSKTPYGMNIPKLKELQMQLE